MNKTIPIIMLAIVVFAISVSAEWCWQENANQASVCGGLGSGSYHMFGNWFGTNCPGNMNDTDWNTYCYTDAYSGYDYINYTKPANALGAVWQLKVENPSQYFNFTVPAACWNAWPDKIVMHADFDRGPCNQYMYCHDSPTTSILLRVETCDGSTTSSALWEEGMWWNMTEPVTCSVCNETCSPCGGGCTATDLSAMYSGVTGFDALYGDITGWNTSCITTMTGMFWGSDFNQDISGWDTSSVVYMDSMFRQNTYFNQPIGSWDTSNVVNMDSIFEGATSFNQPIGSWDTSSMTSLSGLFTGASSFNQDIDGWDVSQVTDMSWLFQNAVSFDQSLSSWVISNVVDMSSMFEGVTLSISNYDAILSQWSTLETVPTGITFHGGNSQYSCTGEPYRDMLVNTYGWDITDGGSTCCVPDWYCIGYTACQPDDLQYCNAVEDNNACGEPYGGDFSEFDPIPCDYCTPVWQCNSWTDCQPGDLKYCNGVEDTMQCGEPYGGDYSEFSAVPCDYCTPIWECTAHGGCLSTDRKLCTEVNDQNACGEPFEGNLSEFAWLACDYCTNSWGCTRWSTCIGGLKVCTQAYDNFHCEEPYLGNFSEFGTQRCEAGSSSGSGTTTYISQNNTLVGVGYGNQTYVAPSLSVVGGGERFDVFDWFMGIVTNIIQFLQGGK